MLITTPYYSLTISVLLTMYPSTMRILPSSNKPVLPGFLCSPQTPCFRKGLLACLILFAPPSLADERLPKWEVGLGVAAARLADYRGSQHGRAYVVPIPYGIYRGDRLRLDRDQNRFRILKTATFSVDWSGAVTHPVESKDSPRREDMPDLEPTLEWGPQLKMSLNEQWTLHTRLHMITTIEDGNLHERGYTVTPSIAWEKPLPHDFTLGARFAVPFGSERHHDYYYGVEPAYTREDRPAYEAPGGSAGANAQVSLSKRTRQAWFGVFVANHFLDGAAMENSPLIDDNTSWSAGFAATWLLLQSNEYATYTRDSAND